MGSNFREAVNFFSEMKKKIIFLSLILLGVFFVQNIIYAASASNGLYSISLISSNNNPIVGQAIDLTAQVIEGGGAWCTLTFGDSTATGILQCQQTECHADPNCTWSIPTLPGDPGSCSYFFSHTYNTSGPKTALFHCEIPTWPLDVTLGLDVSNAPPVCAPDGCNGICPANCDVNQDPDCGCLGGNACCPLGCDNGSDSDCPPSPACNDFVCNQICGDNCDVSQDPDCGCLGGNGCCPHGCANASDSDCPLVSVDSYDNPIVANNIVEFIQQAVILLFTITFPLVILLIIIGGYVMVTSGGIPSRFDKGKKIVIWALVGFAIAAASRGIIALVEMIIGRQ